MHAYSIRRLALTGIALVGVSGCPCGESDCSSELTVSTPLLKATQAELSFDNQHILCDADRESSWDCDFERGSTSITFKLRHSGSLPAQVHVTLRNSEGEELWQEPVTPDYKVQRPNGRDCPPACQSASVTAAD